MAQVATVEQPHEMQLAYCYPADELVKMLDSDAMQGLIAAKAQQHLQCYGANTLPEPAAPPAWRKLLSQFEGPLTVLLLLAMGVSVFAWLNERDTPLPFRGTDHPSHRHHDGRTDRTDALRDFYTYPGPSSSCLEAVSDPSLLSNERDEALCSVALQQMKALLPPGADLIKGAFSNVLASACA